MSISDLVLFVEDNPDFRESAASLLQVHGYEVSLASDGLEALAILHQNERKPDLIVSDISMPRMDGYEFFHAVREQLHLKDIPFIFLTALDQDVQVRLGWTMGVDQYIVKPFKPEEFIAILSNRIDRNRETQAIAEERANDKIEKTRHDLVQVVSHEIRTPLSYVKGGFDLLLEELLAQKEMIGQSHGIQEYVNLIQAGTIRLQRLAEQTMMMTDLTTGASKRIWQMESRPTNLADVISAARPMVEEFAQMHRIQMEYNADADVYVIGVLDLLSKGLSEVMRNAIVFSEPGQMVYVNAYREGDMGVLAVRDNGPGIREEDLDRVWGVMHQSERTEFRRFEQQGFGLGLPITQQIVEIHGGKAYLESAVGEGTTVWLYIPLKP
jgi:two-component system, sensor histidine kinase and response regulator